MDLGAFSVSLAVKDIEKSKSFYEKLEFTVFGGNQEQNWLIMKNGNTVIGLFQGGIQALSRSLYSRLIPREKSAQFYGFFNMLGKFAAVLGPALMGWVSVMTGDDRTSILSIIVLFVLGGLLLSRVDIDKGEEMAKKYLRFVGDQTISQNEMNQQMEKL